MYKDEKFNWSTEKPGIMIRKGGIYSNETKGGIEIAFEIDLTDYTLLTGEDRKFENLSDKIIERDVKTIHTNDRWCCLLYEWNGIEFERVGPSKQNWFICSPKSQG